MPIFSEIADRTVCVRSVPFYTEIIRFRYQQPSSADETKATAEVILIHS